MGLRSFLLGRARQADLKATPQKVCNACGNPLEGITVTCSVWHKTFGTYCSRECVPAVFRKIGSVYSDSLVERARRAGL